MGMTGAGVAAAPMLFCGVYMGTGSLSSAAGMMISAR